MGGKRKSTNVKIVVDVHMDFVQALQSLMALFVEQLNTFSADIATIIKSKLRDWMCSQVAFMGLSSKVCKFVLY